MPFTLIKGTFRVQGYQPDGDSLKLRAHNNAHWNNLDGPSVNINNHGDVQLRFEGVDTLETHYHGSHQPLDIADLATDFTIAAAGITNVQWSANRWRVTSADDGTPGYILSRMTEQYRRPISFVFAGNINRQDGSEVYLDVPWMRQSINYQLAQAGQAYPMYYETLFPDLRDAITGAVISAFNARRGIWSYDWSGGVPVSGIQVLEDYYCIFPKLFRRLRDYLAQNNNNVSGFKQHLANNPEGVTILSTGHFTHLDTVISENGNRIGLTVEPEDLVFEP